jgi:tetratricopeptide (TPR) repeat protein
MIPPHLSLFLYPFPLTLDRDLSPWMLHPLTISFGWIFLIWLWTAAFKSRKTLSAFALGWALVGLAPTHSFIPMLDEQSSRILYMMLPGLSLWLTCLLYARLPMKIGVAAMIPFLLFFAWRTHEQITLWQRPVDLWRKNCEAAPSRWRSWANLAVELAEEKRWNEAEEALQKAKQLDPNHPEIEYNEAAFIYLKDHSEQNRKLAEAKLHALLSRWPHHQKAKELLEKLK